LDHVATGRGGNIGDAADHGHPYERHPVHGGIIFEDGHRDETGTGVSEHLTDGCRGRIPASDNRHPQAAAS
jgi:hypothetical protein